MKPPSTVEDIRKRFLELVRNLDVHPSYRTFHTTPQHDGSPHVEQLGEQYHFVVTERGSELERRRTTDPEEILYWLFDGVTQVAATNYELKNRIEGKDGREVWFPYQEKLLFNLKPEWGIRKQQEHFRILHHHPLRWASSRFMNLQQFIKETLVQNSRGRPSNCVIRRGGQSA